MRKIYIFDTSALIYDPCAWKQFADSDIIIPIAVLNELDKLKKQSGEVGRNARVCIKSLDELSNDSDIITGVLIPDLNTVVKIDATYRNTNNLEYAGFGDPDYGDTQILACAYDNLKIYQHNVYFVSNDINLRVKAKSRGLNAISHENDKYHLTELYPGFITIEDEEAGINLQQEGFIDPLQYGFFHLNPNECILFTDSKGEGIALGRKVSRNKIKFVKKQFPWNINSRNQEQIFAVDLLMDKSVNLVTLIGQAGTGKSLLVLASALELVISKKEYNKFVIYRPIQAVGNEIGYLPGPQPLDAKIATPNGWVTMGDIKVNDFVIGSDGLPKKVLKTFDKGIKEVFKVIFNDGSFTECCEDHLWYTTSLKESQRGTGLGSVKSLKEIRSTLKTYKTQINNHKIPIIKPVHFAEKNTIIDPYIMGVLLGDGTLSEKYSIYFTSMDSEIFENCQKLLPNEMICKLKSKSKKSKACHYTFINKKNINRQHRKTNIFTKEIMKLGLQGTKSSTKFIPELYKYNSVQNRISLLQGLMDTDGFISEDGSDVIYYTTSSRLSEDFKSLIQSLGGIAHINKKIIKDHVSKTDKEILYYCVSFSLPPDICPVRISRKVNRFKPRKYKINRMITEIIPVEMKQTKCLLIESEDHLYATDEFILTHNTMEEKLAPWFQAIMDNFEVLFSNKVNGDWRRDLEMFQKKGKIEMEAITYIRGRSIPNSIILVDEAQNLSKEDVKTILTRAGEGTKVILTGDIEQIDNNILDASNNGLTHVIEKFKTSDLAGHITLTKGERSRLASEAAEIL